MKTLQALPALVILKVLAIAVMIAATGIAMGAAFAFFDRGEAPEIRLAAR